MDNNRLVGLDQQEIKQRLIESLRKQDRFKDFDFEGSNISHLLDVLAFNGYYTALYRNFSINELFLDTASKRESVVARATEGTDYLPKSSRSSTAYIDFIVEGSNPQNDSIILPAYTPVKARVGDKTYTFYNVDSVSSTVENGNYVFKNVEVKEGKPLKINYEVGSGQRFVIPNSGCDTSTIKVRVQESASNSEFEVFAPARDIIDLKPDTPVFYIKEVNDGLYELFFGDDVISKAVKQGNIVQIEYLTCNEDEPNGITRFTYAGGKLLPNTSVALNVVAKSSGGSKPESIESIKQTSRAYRQAQSRCVAASDYKSIIENIFSGIETITVWGGEDETPPVYGKVFISIKPVGAETLTTQQREAIRSGILNGRRMVGIVPEFVDPEFIDIQLNVDVNYRKNYLLSTERELQTAVLNNIKKYNENNLRKFDNDFGYSSFVSRIDSTDSAISNSGAEINLRKRIQPKFNVSARYLFNFSNGIVPGSVISSSFKIPGASSDYYITDDGNGSIQLFYYTSKGRKVVVREDSGTVDYSEGVVDVKRLNIATVPEDFFSVNITPSSKDIDAGHNILQINSQDVSFNMNGR